MNHVWAVNLAGGKPCSGAAQIWGQQVKAPNPILVAGRSAAVAEVEAFGEHLGRPMEFVVAAQRPGGSGCWDQDNRPLGMLKGRFPLGFKLALHRKDPGLAFGAAAPQDHSLPIFEAVAAMEARPIEAGLGEQALSALVRWLRRSGWNPLHHWGWRIHGRGNLGAIDPVPLDLG